MNIEGRHYRTIWPEGEAVCVIDQTRLPFAFEVRRLATMEDAAEAISTMIVRGAPLIGATAAYGVALAMRAGASDAALDEAVRVLGATRPTAVNLHWALERMARVLRPLRAGERAARAFAAAAAICRRGRRLLPRHRRARRRAHPRGRGAKARRAGRHPHPLQRRLARDRRLGHGAGADLRRARCRRAAPCLGRRDAAAQPGRGAHRLRARRARRAAHGRRRQRRRPPDAAWPGRSVHRRLRTAPPRPATSRTRSAPTSRRSRRTTTACRSTPRCRSRPSTGRSATACAKSRSRSVPPARSRI